MQYSGIYLEQQFLFFQGDDIVMSFIIRDSNGAMLTSDIITAEWRCSINNNSDEIKLKSSNVTGGSADQIAVESGGIVTIYAKNADTEDFSEGMYKVELEMTLNSKKYTVFFDKIDIIEQDIDSTW